MHYFPRLRFRSTCFLVFTFLLPKIYTAPSSGVVVIGFAGGFVKHDDTIHKEVQLAAHLQKDYRSGMQARIFANHQGGKAHSEILRLLDIDHDGALSADEKPGARIVL